jgi:hypothetical protein
MCTDQAYHDIGQPQRGSNASAASARISHRQWLAEHRVCRVIGSEIAARREGGVSNTFLGEKRIQDGKVVS